MRKVLLCERSLIGHRRNYLENLLKITGIDFYLIAPENVGVDDSHYIPVREFGRYDLKAYLAWTALIRNACKKYRIDVIHIVDIDSIMRYFRIGFPLSAKIVATSHHLFEGALRRLSYQTFSQNGKNVMVVHTEANRESFARMGIQNAVVCNYPAFSFDALATLDSKSSKAYFKICSTVPVVGIVGGLSQYKGIIPFLNTLQKCTEDFHLLICGKPADISEEEIVQRCTPFKDKCTLILRSLSLEEYNHAIMGSDIIFGLYDRTFVGASGPFTDGVCAGKMILACSHGELGSVTRDKHLGYTANVEDESNVIAEAENALRNSGSFAYDSVAEDYRKTLDPALFREMYYQVYMKDGV